MGRKIFVSYKYADDSVENINYNMNTTVRDYVTEFEKIIEKTDHIYKGESDGEDLSNLSEDRIWQILRNRIYDSSITIIFISPNMKESGVAEKEQWIPWEISYSLKETSRKNKNNDPVISKSNAMIAVVLPDINGSYNYYLQKRDCCSSSCEMHHTDILFKIIRDNKFNLKQATKQTCDNNSVVWYGECNYIRAVRWCDFKNDYDKYIDAAYERQDNIDNYEIVKTV